MKNVKTTLSYLLCLMLPFSGNLQAQKKKDPAKIVAVDSVKTPAKDTAKKETLADKVKSCKMKDGLFRLYQDTVTGSLMIYVRKEQLEKEYLYQSFSISGPPSLFLNQNMLRETWLFSLRRNFDKIYWSRSNTNFYYDKNNPISRAANADVSESVFAAEKIISKDSLGFLISADNLFLSEKLDPVKPNIPPTIPANSYLNLGTLNKDKSEYWKIRSFPKNTDIIVNLSYENPMPQNDGDNFITDARFITVRLQHSLIELPENDFVPRADDPRIGFFTTMANDMSSTDILPFKDYIHRWHLKKKDPRAALSEPVEPIVWWVENTTPVELRQTVINAGLQWNTAFEKAGFKNAVVMKMMPDDADWDPADIRYNVIRWVSSDLGFAIGPSFVNPRTGQILGSDITIDYSFLRGLGMETDLFEKGYALKAEEICKPGQCQMAHGLRLQQEFAKTMLDVMDDDEAEKKELLHQFITELVMHEMGHTMGLMHNMKASHMLSPEQLKDKKVTGKFGVIGSVMDYSTVNLSLDRSKQAHYYTTVTGPYDHWAIEYGYTPFSPGEEKKKLDEIASRSTDPKLIFGNDADICFPGGGIDPRVMVWDMSNDPLSYAEERFQIVDKLVTRLKEKFTKPDEGYARLRNNYNFVFYQRFNMAFTVANYVGGVFVDRSRPGQKSTSLPYTPVAEDQQKKAVQLLCKYVFRPGAIAGDQYLYNYLQAQRRGFNFFGNSEDPKIDIMSFNMYSNVLSPLLSNSTLRRLGNSRMYGNTYTATKLLQDLDQGIFEEDLSGSVNPMRMQLQQIFVERLISLNDTKNPLMGYDTRPAVFDELKKLYKKLHKNKSGDEATRAHRAFLSHQIETALKLED
ncbi:MAG: zinc-dependent metalloprotease [Saprospiraceae bacterium]|nr:zinc-dependent metalloprotease [Saprospiraceae bacterium]HMW39564.1 zinc-dependent metalloprotease [Saprospiraceae bacterium]HMX89303.1 zinc-dependent metalloprotease [Saprospiraceae bacterium]HMZ41201.1 zinc-dependent metalloprotease [Saprospiraceae bacterium]HNB31009.1 zinc-dependent metalloprotease [Saprospiraceae bacterium]